MATNFPTALDTNVELGGAFINVAAVTDPQRQIDATFRNNSNDAMFAVEARIGIDDSTDSTTLTWATLGTGGVQNQGLQFAASGAVWPGQVADAGIFLDSGTNFPAFHRGGDPAATFYGLVADLQIAYDNGATITTAGGIDIAIDGTENVSIALAAAKALIIDGDTIDHTATAGLIDIALGVGATDVMSINAAATNSTNNREFGNYYSTITNTGDLGNSETIYGFKSDITMNGDGPVAAPAALGAHFYAGTATFGGANTYLSVGLLVDATNDYGIASYTGNCTLVWGAADESFSFSGDGVTGGIVTTDGMVNHAFTSGDTTSLGYRLRVREATVGDGGDQLGGTGIYINTDTINAASAPMLAGGVMRAVTTACVTDTADDATSVHTGHYSLFSFENGAGVNDTGPTAYGLHVNMPESRDGGGAYHNNDGTYAFDRWAIYVEAGEAQFRRTLIDAAGIADIGKAMLHIHQGDEDEPFFALDGSGAVTATLNLTDLDGVGAVEGPKVDAWTFVGMYRIEIVDDNTVLTDGDYWAPLFTPV